MGMSRSFITVICTLFVVTGVSSLQSRDLADEAEQLLQELESLVRGDILVAHDDLEDLSTEFVTNSVNVGQKGALAIQEGAATIDEQLNSIIDLAHGVGKDITVCTDVRDYWLGRIPQQYTDDMHNCIAEVNQESQVIGTDARYIVDIIVNKVYSLQSQLRSCRGDLLCISPLVTEIELYKIRLPQNIQTEVQTVESLLTTLRLSTQQCSDTNVSAYIADAANIMEGLIECVDQELGRE